MTYSIVPTVLHGRAGLATSNAALADAAGPVPQSEGSADHSVGAGSQVLLVADDRRLAGALTTWLGLHGHKIDWRRFGADALTRHHQADLVLLDLGLPAEDGLEVLRKLRRVSTVPVLLMGGHHDERSVVRAFNCGADDYVLKPLRLRELQARIAALVRRYRGPAEVRQASAVTVQDVTIDLSARRVTAGGADVALTVKEFNVLAVLAENVGAAVSRERIMDQVWGDAFVGISRSLDVHLVGLRAKLARPGLLRNIRGFGYQLG